MLLDGKIMSLCLDKTYQPDLKCLFVHIRCTIAMYLFYETLFCLIKSFLLKYLFPAAKSLQSCPTLCDPIDSSPPGSPVPGILQARTLEWVAISFSSSWKWKVKVKSLTCVQLLATSWTAAYQAPPSMGFSRQEYWSGVPLPTPKQNPLSMPLIIRRKLSQAVVLWSDILVV